VGTAARRQTTRRGAVAQALAGLTAVGATAAA
jgi:hypothetical protein